MQVSFAGNEQYLPNSAASAFAISPEGTSIAITVPYVILDATSLPLTALLRDDQGNPLAGQTVALTLGASSCSGVSSSTGAVSCSVPGPVPLGLELVGASFAGTPDLLGSSATSITIVIQLPTCVGSSTGGEDESVRAGSFWGSPCQGLDRREGGG